MGCFALFGHPVEGTVDTCVDERILSELEQDGEGYVNCAEFRFDFVQTLFLPDWRAAYWDREGDEPIQVIAKDGSSALVDTRSDGDEAVNAALLPFLRAELCAMFTDGLWDEVRIRPGFGLGVQFHDSAITEYWVASTSRQHL
ncbi:MAG: hypothetical protein U0610_29710 [bacterium]